MGKRQIRTQEKHSEGRRSPYRSELLEGQDESSGLFAWEKRRLGDDSDCFVGILLQGFFSAEEGIHESTSSKGTDPVSGLRDIVFHGVFSLPLFGGLSYNAIYDKNYAK